MSYRLQIPCCSLTEGAVLVPQRIVADHTLPYQTGVAKPLPQAVRSGFHRL